MIIQIDKEIMNYLRKAHYEYIRYKKLLQIIKKDFYPMTDEEWQDSLNYFQRQFQESCITRNTIFETIEEIYGISFLKKSSNWGFNFSNNYLYTEDDFQNIPKEKMIDFSALMYQLYGETIEHPLYGAKDITLQITDNCNMACSYCYQHSKNNHSMSFQTGAEFFERLLKNDKTIIDYCDLENSIGIIINFIGGEPLLEIETIDKLSKYCLGLMFKLKHPLILKFMFSICSNGLNHFNSKVQEYLNIFDEFCSYSISLDGYKELHDACRFDLKGQPTYDRVVESVKDYLQTHHYIGNKLTLSPNNIQYTYNAIISLIEMGYETIHFNCVYEKGWDVKHATILYDQLKRIVNYLKEKNIIDNIELSIFSDAVGIPLSESENDNWCGGTGKMLAMNYKGEFFPCLRYMETSSNINYPLYKIGNLQDGINQTQESKVKINNLKSITRKSQSTDECFNCPIAGGCGWCSAYNYEEFGTPNKRTTYHCIMHKARSLANYYYHYMKNEPIKLYCPKEWAVEIIGDEEYNYLKSLN